MAVKYLSAAIPSRRHRAQGGTTCAGRIHPSLPNTLSLSTC